MRGYSIYGMIQEASGGYLNNKEVMQTNYYEFMTYIEYNRRKAIAQAEVNKIK